MLEYCTYACRTVIFVTILTILGYIILINEKKNDTGKRIKSLLEKFVDCDGNCDVNRTEIIRTVFRNYLGRDPTPDEIDRYGSIMNSSSDVMSVVNAVKSSDEYKQLVMAADKKDFVLNMSEIQSSPLLADLEKVEVNKRLAAYRDIAKMYNKNLDRMPNNRELTYYSHKMLTDKAFTLIKLETVLQSSQEFKMIQQSQSNNVNGELQGNITDAQVTMDVRNMYKDVFDGLPIQEQEVYLKTKYIEYNLDRKKFTALLLLIKEMDTNREVITKDGELQVKARMIIPSDESATTQIKLTSSETILDPLTGKPISLSADNSVIEEQWNSCKEPGCKKEDGAKDGQQQPPQPIYQNPNIINIINPSAEELDKLLSTIDKYDLNKKEVNNASGKKCYSNDYSQDPLYKRMGKTGPEGKSCAFNKDGLENWLKSKDRQVLAEYQLTRELDGLKNNCTRNTYFMNVDDDLKRGGGKSKGDVNSSLQSSIDSFDSIGAPLDEAKKTHVGSIMPVFVYREGAAS